MAKILDFTERLTPGAEIAEGTEPGRWRPTGQADGVVYLDEVRKPTGETIIKSSEREALRYLKPQTLEWYALRGQRGVTFVNNFWGLLNAPHNKTVGDQIKAAAAEQGQPLNCMLATVPHVTGCLGHLTRWHLVAIPGEAKVWALFYA
jgi:hypothetical protein